MQKAGGRLALGELDAAMETFYGRAPDRGTLGVLAQQVGITLSGDELLRPVSVLPQALPVRVGGSLAGIPTELREMFEELVQQPLSHPSELRSQAAEQSYALLDRWDELSIPERHLASAAIGYFVSFEDVEHDLDIGGLDDGKQIMNAVLSYLGMLEEDDVAVAS